jgi:hypothetical protein
MSIPGRARSGEINVVYVNRVTRFGERQDLRLEGVVGANLEDVLRSDVTSKLLQTGVSVMFRYRASEEFRNGKKAVVKGVYPEVFHAGCVVVIECIGPAPQN